MNHYNKFVIIFFLFFSLFCYKEQEDKDHVPKYPVEMPGVWKEVGVNELRSGNTFAFSKNGTVVYIVDPAVCIKRERAMIGEYLWSKAGLHIYFYKFLQLEGGDLEKVKKKCESGNPDVKFEERLAILNSGSIKFIQYGDFKEKKTNYDFDDLITFRNGGNEFYRFSAFPEHFQEIVDHEIKGERRLILKKGNVHILNNTAKDIIFSLD
ncbi:hypothetical protein EHQ52_14940 [Leptospira koniambonensis]|uniref:Uncharacterized protein n=1 Tax=Leptospira koniambonensis TaxID=2484950 RepID=A0A4R9J4Q6_9LEPT|nr:hypothetical protein [Leptospira koniambonensis]TGL32576.1 hypothetical protein EHQ52_14940 [Leptospira koniambonensis]